MEPSGPILNLDFTKLETPENLKLLKLPTNKTVFEMDLNRTYVHRTVQ